MNKFKKIGLTALAASLVTTSAFAGELTASGTASIGLKNTTGSNDPSSGKSWTMNNSVILAGSGELDNGLTVSMSFELDQADDTTTGLANSPFDGHSVTVASDSMGTLKFSGEGGSSAQGAMDTTAAGDIWNNGMGVAGPTAAASGNNSLYYTLPEMMEGVAITASMSPGGTAAGQDTLTSFGLVYTGVEGLTLKYGQGDSGIRTAETESTTMMASYAIGSFTVSASNTEADGTTTDREVDAFQIAYTVSDDLSVTYGEETFDTTASGVDEEVESFGVSYTTGGMTLSANTYEATGGGNVAGAKSERWALTAAFAF